MYNKKIVKKLSLNMLVISTTLLGSYVVNNNPILKPEPIGLMVVSGVSTLSLIKCRKQDTNIRKNTTKN